MSDVTSAVEVEQLRGLADADQDHLPRYWRRHPTVVRGVVRDASLLDSSRFDPWCRRPAVERIYLLDEAVGAGAARALPVADPAQLLALREEAVSGGRAVTALLNHVERVSDDVVRLRDDLGIAMPWRLDDVVATWSMSGSGIGYHVGHEDGFIVQLAGSRRWRVFAPAASEAASHLAVLGDPDFADHLTTRPHGTEPVLEVELRAGDAIAVPALHPHEGVTLEGPSLSLSIGWRGLNVHRLLRESGVVGTDHRVPAPAKTAWFGLLPDRPAATMRTVIEERARRCLELAPLPVGSHGDDQVEWALRRVLQHWDAGCPR